MYIFNKKRRILIIKGDYLSIVIFIYIEGNKAICRNYAMLAMFYVYSCLYAFFLQTTSISRISSNILYRKRDSSMNYKGMMKLAGMFMLVPVVASGLKEQSGKVLKQSTINQFTIN